MTLKTRNKAMLYVLSKRQIGVFKVGESDHCYLARYEEPFLSGKYHYKVWMKPDNKIEEEIQEALAELEWQGRGDHWRGKLY